LQSITGEEYGSLIAWAYNT